MARGGSISVAGEELGPRVTVHARIEGAERTSAAFKDARRQFNAAMRAVITEAGERAVLPAIKGRFPSRSGRMAGSLYVKRDRTTVFIGSRLRGGENRAVGWIDFGGKHPRHHNRRRGLYVIVTELDKRRSDIDDAVLIALMKTFGPNLEHTP